MINKIVKIKNMNLIKKSKSKLKSKLQEMTFKITIYFDNRYLVITFINKFENYYS